MVTWGTLILIGGVRGEVTQKKLQDIGGKLRAHGNGSQQKDVV